MKVSLMKALVLALVTISCVGVQGLLQHLNTNLISIRVPISWGMAKDILDIPVLVLASWGGWPAVAIEIVGVTLGLAFPWRLLACLGGGILYGAISAIHSYNTLTVSKVSHSVVTYALIYAVALIMAYLVIKLLTELSGRMKR